MTGDAYWQPGDRLEGPRRSEENSAIFRKTGLFAFSNAFFQAHIRGEYIRTRIPSTKHFIQVDEVAGIQAVISQFFPHFVFFSRLSYGHVVMSIGGDNERGMKSAQTRKLPSNFTLGSKDDLGRFLDEFRPYLLTIATEQFPEAIYGKLGVSDLVQETILKGFENYDQFQGTTREEFAQWLKAILNHQLANTFKAFRTLKRDVELEVSADELLVHANQQSPDEIALIRERRLQVEEAVGRLSDEDRETIHLRHRDNLTFAEIGVRQQKSEDAARNGWIRAVQQLRQELRRNDSKIP